LKKVLSSGIRILGVVKNVNNPSVVDMFLLSAMEATVKCRRRRKNTLSQLIYGIKAKIIYESKNVIN
jgi:hypothetical protein